MSWSISVIGKPENVVKEIEAESERLTGASKEEFLAAKACMVAAVTNNFGDPMPLVVLDASGHSDGTKYRQFRMKVEPQYTKLV